MEELKELADKEIQKIGNVVKELRIIDNSGLDLYNLILSYFTDAKYFFGKKDFVRAFEAAVICWAYCDAGIHLKVFFIGNEFKKYFTVE